MLLFHLLAEAQQLHVEIQGGLAGDTGRGALLSVGIVVPALENGLLSLDHRCEAQVPSLDDLPHTDREDERLTPIPRGIELAPVGLQGTGVVGVYFPSLQLVGSVSASIPSQGV